MRIALYHNLPSGGAKRTLTEATKRLAANHQIDVFSLASANHTFADLRPYVAEHTIFPFQPRPLFQSPFGRLNQLVRLSDLLRLEKVMRAMAKIINRGDYDVLLAHPCQFEKSPSLLNFVTIPTVYYCQEPLRHLYEPAPFRPYDDVASVRRQWLNRIDPLPPLYFNTLKRIDRRNTRRADTVLVNSKFIRASVRKIYGVKAAVSYHGIDAELFRPMAVEKQNIVLSVGSLTPLKGFDFLIEMMAKLPEANRPVLVIVSNFQNPPEKQYLQQLAEKWNVTVDFLTNINDMALVELYNQAKVVAYAPLREPFGLVPLEAMACRTPIVAVREGGIPETVINGHTGTLVPRDAAQFADAIAALLEDSALAATYGENGRAHVLKNWTWARAAATLETHLTDTCRAKTTAVAASAV